MESSQAYNVINNPKTFEVAGFQTAYYFPGYPGGTDGWEKYDFAQAFLLLSGSAVYETEQASYPVRPGMLVYRPAGHASQYVPAPGASFALISFSCASEQAKLFEGAPIPLFGEERTTLLEIMKTGARVCETIEGRSVQGMRLKPNIPAVVTSYICSSLERFFCILFCRLSGIGLTVDESQKLNRALADSKLMGEVRDYLDRHLTENLVISQISRRFWISPTALMKKFKRENGVGINAYLIERRLDEAKRLIRTTDLSFGEIAERLGFSSVQYFSKLFRSRVGITPTEFSRAVSKRRSVDAE